MEVLLALWAFATSAPGIGVIGGIVTVIITKRIDNVIDKRKAKNDGARIDLDKEKQNDELAGQIRDELRAEITGLRTELRETRAELEKWRGEYYTKVEELIKTQAELNTHLNAAKKSVEKLA